VPTLLLLIGFNPLCSFHTPTTTPFFAHATHCTMSGFEIAGIVLAVLPLIVEGLKAYPNTTVSRIVKAFTATKKQRREFTIDLISLNTELRFVILDVLKPITGSLTVDQVQVLDDIDSTGARFFRVWTEVWEANPAAVEMAFRHTQEDIQPVLKDMVEILSEMLGHTGISYDDGREVLKGVINESLLIKNNLSKKIKFALSDSKRRNLLRRMRKNIELLKSLVQGQEKASVFFAHAHRDLIEPQQSYGPFLESVRSCSNKLHHALSTMWDCTCHESRSARLRLERRETADMKANELQFSLFLTFKESSDDQAWGFRETKVCVIHKYVIWNIS
jgi:hypothetical protein